MALPSTLAGVSRRRCGLPIIVNCAAGLSGTSFGTGSLEAASATSPNVSFLNCGERMTPSATLQLRASTPHSSAAALTSIVPRRGAGLAQFFPAVAHAGAAAGDLPADEVVDVRIAGRRELDLDARRARRRALRR